MAVFQRIPWSRARAKVYPPLRAVRNVHSETASKLSAIGPVRTRFAPSPTGYLHLGSLRTALFNYLWAKKFGGQFLLRIEDTDKNRTVPGAEEAIYRDLRWAGLQWDEGPEVGGPFGPYRQSERAALHQEHARKLIQTKHAYRCFCSRERLQAIGQTSRKMGKATDYDRACTKLSEEESNERASKGESFVVRLKMPSHAPDFEDMVYGKIKQGAMPWRDVMGMYEDPVLLKSDGLPTYHLANVVDDHHMQITHVLRATEWMPSTHKHVYLYEAFGWKPPMFAHLGLLQNSEKKKLSKREGDVDVSKYREKGYLPEALDNFVALLGWSHTLKSDVLEMSDMLNEFSIERLTTGNTIVSFKKLEHLQKAHAQKAITEGTESGRGAEITSAVQREVVTLYGEKLVPEGNCPSISISDEYIGKILQVFASRYTLPAEFAESINYFFIPPTYTDAQGVKVAKKLSKEEDLLEAARTDLLLELKAIPDEQWTSESKAFDCVLEAVPKEDKYNRLKVLRWAVAAGRPGPGMKDIMTLLGKERTIYRLENAPRASEAMQKMASNKG